MALKKRDKLSFIVRKFILMNNCAYSLGQRRPFQISIKRAFKTNVARRSLMFRSAALHDAVPSLSYFSCPLSMGSLMGNLSQKTLKYSLTFFPCPSLLHPPLFSVFSTTQVLMFFYLIKSLWLDNWWLLWLGNCELCKNCESLVMDILNVF